MISRDINLVSQSVPYRHPMDEYFVELAGAVIEQAVFDWETLERGRLNRCIGKSDQQFIYTEEVVEFFQSRWFEHLLSFALPTHTAAEVRRALCIPEPIKRRKKRCVKS